MTALARLEKLPDWPARMTAPIAAAYMGVSQSTFLARFGDTGRKEGANTFWARAQLDRYIADQFGLVVQETGGPVDSEYDKWKAGRGR